MNDVSSITVYVEHQDGTVQDMRDLGPDLTTAKFHVDALRASGQYRRVGYRLNRY